MMHGHETSLTAARRGAQPNPASTGRRLKRNVRIGDRRTTIVLEAYVWDSIDSMLLREAVALDDFCNRVEDTRRNSSMASSARLVVLIYFRLLGQINSPPFVDDDLDQLQQEGRLRAPGPADPPTRRFRYYRLRSGALRKTKRMLHSLVRIRDLATGVGDVGNTV